MKKALILGFLLGCCFQHVFAQKNKDFILTMNQDTLFGKVLLKQENVPIVFKYQQRKLSYHPKTIQAFGIFDNNKYQRFIALKSTEGRAVFVKVMVDGYWKLYKYNEKHDFRNQILERYVYFIGHSNQKLTTISSSSYKRILRQLFHKHPSFLSKLETCSFKEVPQLIALFNQLRPVVKS